MNAARQEDASKRALGAALTLAPFAAVKGVADETLKLAARGANGAPLGVLLCSPPLAPGLVARGREAALGHVGLARESFPLARYAEMSRDARAAFDAAS